MVCTFVAQYTYTKTAQSSATWTVNIDPPQEIGGKECVLKLVSAETSPVTAVNRVPCVVSISNLTQSKSRLTQFISTATSETNSDPVNNTTVGFLAINNTSAINNPSIHCFIPESPQQWTINVTQVDPTTAYLGGANFSMVLIFQVSPISKA
jgi:hypothetical protein